MALSNPSIGGRKKIPVILDTDIGTDIDDTWALGLLLKCPELDLKLVTSDEGDTTYRARIIAKFLEVTGRTDVPVGVGIRQPMKRKSKLQTGWIKNYSLSRYPGRVYPDGVGALIDTIMNSKEKVTLICIGPVPNIGAALKREPRIASRARFVGMHGSLFWSHHSDGAPIAEYNVKKAVNACQRTFTAPWEKTITPLDTCGRVRLTGRKYRAVVESSDPVARAVIENYEVWKKYGGWVQDKGMSSILFDCVAFYLAFTNDLLKMRRMGVRVTDDGRTVEDRKAPRVNCALEWRDMRRFEDLLVQRLTQ